MSFLGHKLRQNNTSGTKASYQRLSADSTDDSTADSDEHTRGQIIEYRYDRLCFNVRGEHFPCINMMITYIVN